MKTIMNLISTIRSNSNDACKLARELARIPGVDLNTIKVWNAPSREKTGTFSSVEFMGINVKFDWHDHQIKLHEKYDGKLTIKYDGNKIAEIFWSALWGRLDMIPFYNENHKFTRAQDYILDALWKAVYNISAKGRPYEKVALPKTVQYGDCHIWAEGPVIYVKFNDGETIRAMGNTWRGLCWTACDSRLTELQKVIKKAFIEY